MASARPGEEYEEIVLYSIRGPENGVCPIALAVRKEEGALYGLWGDRVGDVIYFLKPPYKLIIHDYQSVDPTVFGGGEVRPGHSGGSHHEWLPTATYGILQNSAMFLMSGPGVRKGVISEKPINLVDIAPTIAWLMDIPVPAQSEGRILREFLE